MAPGIFGLFRRGSSKSRVNLVVITPNCTLECTVFQKTTGKDLFDQVIETTDIANPEYFDIRYQRPNGEFEWIDPDKLIVEHRFKKEEVAELLLEVKFYPEDAYSDITDDVTLNNIFEYVRQKVVAGELDCSLGAAIHLASYAVQAKLGDFDDDVEDPTYQYLKGDYWISRAHTESKKNKFSKMQLREQISTLHRRHKGQPKSYAQRKYLKLAQTIEGFGMEFYRASLVKLDDARYENAGLGVTPLGIKVYKSQDKPKNPVNVVNWGSIVGISPSSHSTKLKFQLRDTSNVKHLEVSVKRGKQLYAMCVGYQQLFEKRRRPSSRRLSPVVDEVETSKKKRKHEKDKEKDAIRQKILVNQANMKERMDAMDLKVQVMQKIIKAHDSELMKLSSLHSSLKTKKGRSKKRKHKSSKSNDQDFEKFISFLDVSVSEVSTSSSSSSIEMLSMNKTQRSTVKLKSQNHSEDMKSKNSPGKTEVDQKVTRTTQATPLATSSPVLEHRNHPVHIIKLRSENSEPIDF